MEKDENVSESLCKTKLFECQCEKKFNARSTFYKHKKNCPVAQEKAQSERSVAQEKRSAAPEKVKLENFICKESGCNFRSFFAKDFIAHLQNVHDFQVAENLENFESYSEFLNWKVEYEKTTKSSFLLRKTHKTLTGRTEYFQCNRSGNYTSQSTGKRRSKAQGLRKIGFNCPASLKVHVQNDPEKVVANVCGLHYGHNTQLCHLSIPKHERKEIAKQLNQGLDFARVLQNVYSSKESEMERKHLCTRRDLLNISKSYNIENTVSSDDEHSLNADASIDSDTDETSAAVKGIQGEKFDEDLKELKEFFSRARRPSVKKLLEDEIRKKENNISIDPQCSELDHHPPTYLNVKNENGQEEISLDCRKALHFLAQMLISRILDMEMLAEVQRLSDGISAKYDLEDHSNITIQFQKSANAENSSLFLREKNNLETYEVEVTTSKKDSPNENSGPYSWNYYDTTALIDEVHLHDEKFEIEKPNQVWKKISDNLQKKGIPVNWKQCNNKWKGLKLTFSNIKKHNSTPGNRKRHWEYYEIMDKIHSVSTSSTIEPNFGKLIVQMGNTANIRKRKADDKQKRHKAKMKRC